MAWRAPSGPRTPTHSVDLIRADNATVRRRCKDALREGNSLRDQLRLTQEALSGSQAACTRLEKHVRDLEEKLRKAKMAQRDPNLVRSDTIRGLIQSGAQTREPWLIDKLRT